MLLNIDSRMSLVKIGKKVGEDVETVRYRLKKLSKSKIITRFTIVMEKPPKAYEIAFFMNLEFAPGLNQRNQKALEYYFGRNEAMQLTNSFQYLALLSGSYLFFGLGGFENEEEAFKNAIDVHRQIYEEDNPVIEHAKIVGMVKGSLPIRNIDMQRNFKMPKLD
jgi:DNA-binding Lrp family transcriptional regulator